MALALDGSTPAQVDKSTAGSTATTASFTAPANALLLAFFESDEGGQINSTIADTGGLTWTRIARICTNTVGEANTPTPTGTAQDGYVSVWKATTSSSTSRTVTVTVTGAGGTTREGLLSVLVLTDSGGAPGTGAVTAKGGSASAPSNTATTTANNSWVWAGSSDWSAAGAGTVGSGQTMQHDHPGTNVSAHVWKQSATTASSGTAVTMNLTGPASQTWNIVIVEVTANAAAGSASVFVPPALPGRTWLRRFHRRQIPPGVAADVVTPITLPGDTGTGTDALTIAAAVPLADTGAGTDALTVAATTALSDTGSGTDTLAVNAAVPLSETGTGTDTLAAAASVPLADTGTGTDALTTITVTVNLSDTGSLVDDMSVDTGSTPKSLTDTGTGTDALTATATAAIAETSTGTDALSVAATVTLAADTLTGVDAMTVARAIPLAETGGFVETFAVTVTLPLSELAAGTDLLVPVNQSAVVIRITGLSITQAPGSAVNVAGSTQGKVAIVGPGSAVNVAGPTQNGRITINRASSALDIDGD